MVSVLSDLNNQKSKAYDLDIDKLKTVSLYLNRKLSNVPNKEVLKLNLKVSN